MNQGRILVVDDDPQIRRVLRTTLVLQGYEVADARSGQEAIEKFREGKYDLILLDMNMADMDGIATCREIRSFSDVGIVMLTIRDTEKDKVTALDAGADDYVTKPFSTPELLARVRAALRRVPNTPEAGPQVDQIRRSGSRSSGQAHQAPWQHHSTDAKRVRTPAISHPASQCPRSPYETAASGLGTGLWRGSRISPRVH